MDKNKKHFKVKKKGGAITHPPTNKANPQMRFDRLWIRNLIDSLFDDYCKRISVSKGGQQAISQIKENYEGHLFDFLCCLPFQWDCRICLKAGFKRYDELFQYHLRMDSEAGIWSKQEVSGAWIPTFYNSTMYETMDHCLLNMAIHMTAWANKAEAMSENWEKAKITVEKRHAKIVGNVKTREIFSVMNQMFQSDILGKDFDEDGYNYSLLEAPNISEVPF